MTDNVLKKLDPDLRRIRRQLVQSAAQTEEDAKAAAAHTSEPEPEVCMPRDLHVLVRFRGRIEDLVAAGLRNPAVFEHRNHDLKVAGGDIVPERLGDLAAIDHVISISMPPPLEPLLNYSVPEARARSLQSGPQALTGKGVVIGIIDTGIEWRHGSFLTPEGNTRIRAICDLNLTPRPADGNHPAEKGFDLGGAPLGVIYDTEWINLALRGERRIRTEDVEALSGNAGHGTHVAGIAAGNGSPRDCCAWSRSTYAGVAPGAEIVAVRVAGPVNLLDQALNFIRDYVRDKPLVVNISMGANSGPHDGTRDFEQLIDNFVAPPVVPPARPPTRVVVAAAGNGGDKKRHVHVTVPATGEPVDVPLKVNADDNRPRNVELWYVNGQRMNMEVIAPDGTSSGIVLHGDDRVFVLNAAAPPAEQVVITIGGTANDPNNNDPYFKVSLSKPIPGRGTLTEGEWKLRLTNAGAIPVDVHAWVTAGDTDLKAPIFPVGFSSDMTISFPASARGAIAVANYESRRSQCDCCASGEVVDSSSRGPVRNESAANPNPKPTIAAPGEDITSAKYDACTLNGECCDWLPDVCWSQYVPLSGTSMAAPHVTGAVALMLELDPTVIKDDIVRYLSDTARRGPAGQEGVWGAGKLDVGAAIQLMRDLRPGLPGPPAPVAAARSGVDALRRVPARDAADALSWTAPAWLSIPTTTPSAIEFLRARVREVPGGEVCAALVSRHFSEVRRLVNTNRRIATLWHRGEGPALLRRLLHGAADPTAPSPVTSVGQRVYLERMFTQLRRHGSPRLQVTLDQYGPMLLRLLETPLAAQAASAAPEVHP